MMVASRGHAENGGRKTTESNPGSSGIWWRYCRSVMLSASGGWRHLRSAAIWAKILNLIRSELDSTAGRLSDLMNLVWSVLSPCWLHTTPLSKLGRRAPLAAASWGMGCGYRCSNIVPARPEQLGLARIRTVPARPGLASGPCRADPRASSEAQARPTSLIIVSDRPTARRA